MREDDYVEAKTSAKERSDPILEDLSRKGGNIGRDRSIERLRRKLVRRCG